MESGRARPTGKQASYRWEFEKGRKSLSPRFDCFLATSKEKTARKYGVHGVNVFVRKPI